MMRGAHSIKGACRIVGIELGVRLSHVMEDALVAAQNGHIRLTPADIDTLLRGGYPLGARGTDTGDRNELERDKRSRRGCA
ncbi:MAG: Hpt domain-containing protein [Gemmataceae bacterium]